MPNFKIISPFCAEMPVINSSACKKTAAPETYLEQWRRGRGMTGQRNESACQSRQGKKADDAGFECGNHFGNGIYLLQCSRKWKCLLECRCKILMYSAFGRKNECHLRSDGKSRIKITKQQIAIVLPSSLQFSMSRETTCLLPIRTCDKPKEERARHASFWSHRNSRTWLDNLWTFRYLWNRVKTELVFPTSFVIDSRSNKILVTNAKIFQ